MLRHHDAAASRGVAADQALEVVRQRFRRAAALVAVTAVLYVAWLASALGSAFTRSAVSDLVFVAAPACAALACGSAHRARGGRHSAWAWLAAACWLWAVSSLVWSFQELALGEVAPFPSLADIGYVAFPVPAAVAMTRFPRGPGTQWSRWRVALDGVVIAASLLLAAVVWVLQPVVESSELDLTRATAAALPIADVLLAATVLTRSMVFPLARRRVWVLLSGGLLSLVVADSVYVARGLDGTFAAGGMGDAGWLLSFALIALAALTPVTRPTQPPSAVTVTTGDPPAMLQQLVPYLAMAVGGAAVLTEPGVLDDHPVYLLLALVLLAAGSARELVTVADHVRLARHLASAVERRTGELQHREQWWRELVQNLTDVVVVVNRDGTIRYCSPSANSALGSWPQQAAHAFDLLAHLHSDDHETLLATFRPVLAGERRHGFVECRIERADGSWGWFEVTAVGQLQEQALAGTVLTLHDVSERRRLTDQLTHEAHHDSLTGLPNRALLMKRIEAALLGGDARRSALLLIDLDDFKVINDRHGHAAGDVVLQVIARRLAAAVRAEDTVARLGGDEFALLMRGTGEQVRAAARRLLSVIEEPVATDGRTFVVRGSVGVVFAAEDGQETAHSLLSHADIALYEAKGRGKGGTVVIEDEEREAAAKQVHLREQVAQPELEQFSVVYQPIVDVVTGRMRGVESLLRWHHPDLGAVAPDDFIPMAEAGGSIRMLGWFVLEEACRQVAHWRRVAPGHRMAVGVNVSSLQLDEPHFAARVLDLLTSFGIEPDQLVLELTEQSLVRDFETAVLVVAQLRAGGVSVAVDDYGTGYSSLRYLHRFDADVVKIDRSFIANLQDSVHTQKIVRSVMDMARALDLQSIAEGIETSEQLGLVRELGCELAQGYLFSRPVAAEQIEALLVADADFATDDMPYDDVPAVRRIAEADAAAR